MNNRVFFGFLFMMLFIMASCDVISNSESSKDDCEEVLLFEAKQFFENTDRSQTKSMQPGDSFFQRMGAYPLWSKAVITETDDRYYIDVPAIERFRYHMIFFDGIYFRLTESHFSFTFIIHKSTGAISLFNHFFLPQMNDMNWPGLYEEGFYCGFISGAYRSGYSGLEIYSAPTGEVVTLDVYDKGEIKSHTYAFDNEGGKQHIERFFDTFAVLSFFELKTKDVSYVCPICEGEYFWFDENLGYVCTNCNYAAFYEGELEASQIIGSFSYEEYDWWNDDYPCDPQDPWWDEYLNYITNGSGNNSGGNPGVSGGQQEEMWTYVYPGDSNITVRFPAEIDSTSFLVENLKSTLDFIYVSYTSLIDGLSGLSITFEYNENLSDPALTTRSERIVEFRESTIPVIVEELFHIYQYQNLSFRDRNMAYYEFEAKCFLVATLGSSFLCTSQGCATLWNSAEAFLSNQTADNFMFLRDALHFWGTYNTDSLYYLPGNMLPNIYTLDIDIDFE